MIKDNLQNWLIDNSGFRKQYKNLLVDSVAKQFPNLNRNDEAQMIEHNWNYLLLCASLLAQSEVKQCQGIALRIAQYCLESDDSSDLLKDAAAVILDQLANQPAIILAEKRAIIQPNFSDRLPFFLFQDWTRRSIENSISLISKKSFQGSKFQNLFWNNVENCDWMSVSAPTSAGKSYIIGRWLIDYIARKAGATIVYIVPTRALIQQVYSDIEKMITSDSLSNVSISTLPLKASFKENATNFFVFTQERLHILLGAFDNKIPIDILVVDEAQKIGDSYRGVLLQQAIDAVSQGNPSVKILFASPMTENPETLLEDAPNEVMKKDIKSEDITVNQNLLWVSQIKGKPKHWNLELIFDENPILIGQVDLEYRPNPQSKRLPFIAFSLGNPSGGNVIYVNGAADAEKAAMQLFDLVGDCPKLSDDEEITALADLIKKTIHKQYSLAKIIFRGIAYHYGNMPLLVRTEIERLFRSNKLKYLFCTSTLIEGVNMPCQSIFVRGPQKGRGTPMNASDFWNLAGRAGRWGKEFQGNVICIDPRQEGVWQNGAPLKQTNFIVKRTADDILLNHGNELFEYIKAGAPLEISKAKQSFEYVFSYVVTSYIRNGDIMSSPWAQKLPDLFVIALEDLVGDVLKSISIQQLIVLKNPGISPLAMENLFQYFEERTKKRKEPIEGLIPVPIESEDALQEYIKILYRINKFLGNVFGERRRINQLALLIVDWMKGYPLSRIISNRERYYGSSNLSTLIRNTMKDVEEFARFKAPKYLTCYVDVLRLHLELNQKSELLNDLPELNVLLEFGVSQKTQLSLIELGLSRSSAIYISELIANDSFNEVECLRWLVDNDWMTTDMPGVMKTEIATMLSNKRKVVDL